MCLSAKSRATLDAAGEWPTKVFAVILIEIKVGSGRPTILMIQFPRKGLCKAEYRGSVSLCYVAK
jgi:hypothetical protein